MDKNVGRRAKSEKNRTVGSEGFRKPRFYFLGSVLIAALSVACSTSSVRKPAAMDEETPVAPKPPVIRADYAPGEVMRLCKEAMSRAKKSLDEIGALSPSVRDVDRTLLAFEEANAELMDATQPLTFMKFVSTDEKISQESSECEEKISQFIVDLMGRKDLYRVIKDQAPRTGAERRLLSETIKGFEKNGLKLSDDKLAKVKDLLSRLESLKNQFTTNLNNDQSSAEFTAEEMEGAPESLLSRLKKSPQGRYVVTTKSPDFVPFMENVKSSEARRRMALVYNRRAAEKNTKLLEQAVALRQQLAALMGFETWADYQTQGRMAENSQIVWSFLRNLQAKLSERNRADLAKLLAYKKELDPSAKRVDLWDVAYLANQLKKRDYSIDDEMIREYFPAETVVAGVLEIYSRILGVKFREVVGVPVWASGVKQYEVSDAKSGEVLSFFYTDLYPRPLKYGHAAAFGLISGRQRNGKYTRPVASIVSNFTPPSEGKPSLLSHREVETFFHEFGHIMHQVLTRAPYASLSGVAVPWDFVEAPSQMLQNWAWNPEILTMVSGHYQKSSKKLPDALLKKMIEARNFNQGHFYTRQLLFASFDMSIHTASGEVDVTATHDRLMREIMSLEPQEGGRFPATFGHMMGGYDAGYYGYLWSEVYAQDMFTRFEKAGLLSAEAGMPYRRSILEKGNMVPAMDLLREFLGREPNAEAFFKKLGISHSAR